MKFLSSIFKYSCLDKEKNTNGLENRKIWNLISFSESSAVRDFGLEHSVVIVQRIKKKRKTTDC